MGKDFPRAGNGRKDPRLPSGGNTGEGPPSQDRLAATRPRSPRQLPPGLKMAAPRSASWRGAAHARCRPRSPGSSPEVLEEAEGRGGRFRFRVSGGGRRRGAAVVGAVPGRRGAARGGPAAGTGPAEPCSAPEVGAAPEIRLRGGAGRGGTGGWGAPPPAPPPPTGRHRDGSSGRGAGTGRGGGGRSPAPLPGWGLHCMPLPHRPGSPPRPPNNGVTPPHSVPVGRLPPVLHFSDRSPRPPVCVPVSPPPRNVLVCHPPAPQCSPGSSSCLSTTKRSLLSLPTQAPPSRCPHVTSPTSPPKASPRLLAHP